MTWISITLPSWEETLKIGEIELVRIINNVGLNSKNIVNSVNIFNDSVNTNNKYNK